MAECATCWLLSGRFRLPVHAYAPGRKKKKLDMSTVMDGQDVGIEVKAPYREPPRRFWMGDDAHLLRQCLDSANKQFSSEVANVLVIVPQVRTRVFSDRDQLVTALYGQERITFFVNTETGAASEETIEFSPEGRLLRRRLPSGRPVKPSGEPGYTRVSAVIVVEESPSEVWLRKAHSARMTGVWMHHDMLVAHNPHAQYPIGPDFFRGYVQFMDLGEGYGWNDGEPL